MRDLTPIACGKKSVLFRNFKLKAVFVVFSAFEKFLDSEFFANNFLRRFECDGGSAMCFASRSIFGNKTQRLKFSR